MSGTEEMATDSRHWLFPIARAVPAALMAVAITFTADHSARLGLAAFGGFALLSGLVMLSPGIRRTGPLPADAAQKTARLAQGVVTLIAGAVALAAAVLIPVATAQLPALVAIVAGWGVLAGGLELYSALRARGRHAGARDAGFLGVLTILLAAVMLIVPQDYAEAYAVPDGASGVVTASIMLVGALGAYGAIAAVFLLIAGFSLKPVSTAGAGASPTQEQATQDGTP